MHTRSTLLRTIAAALSQLADLEEDKDTAAEPSSVTYSTTGPLPPGRSRRWLREHAAEMGGTRRGGSRGRGVVWTVTHQQYMAWLAGRTTNAPQKAEPAAVVSIDAWVRSAGYRATRSAR